MGLIFEQNFGFFSQIDERSLLTSHVTLDVYFYRLVLTERIFEPISDDFWVVMWVHLFLLKKFYYNKWSM